jgi:hypothetical protein
MINNKHHVVGVLAKSTLCNCGCHGWCSIWQLFEMLDWSFVALAEGVHPRRRHDGQPPDPYWLSLAGCHMGFKAVVILIKGDWAEFCGSLGFPTWASAEHPCVKCVCSRDTLYVTRGLSALSAPLPAKTMAMYSVACNGAEIVIHPVTVELWRKVRVLLFYDLRKNSGNRGRCLMTAIPEHGLEKGDRLEPSPCCRDTGAGFDAAPPERLVFWRCNAQTLTTHRNPLFNAVTHITPERMVFDYLHVCCLGVFKDFLSFVTWSLIDVNAWGVTPLPMDVRQRLSVQRLRSELFAWYGKQIRLGRRPNKVQELTHGMLGTRDEPDLKLHGAECNTYLGV